MLAVSLQRKMEVPSRALRDSAPFLTDSRIGYLAKLALKYRLNFKARDCNVNFVLSSRINICIVNVQVEGERDEIEANALHHRPRRRLWQRLSFQLTETGTNFPDSDGPLGSFFFKMIFLEKRKTDR